MVESDMPTPYEIWPGLQSHPLGRKALKIREAYRGHCRLSPLIAMSDPVRTPDIISWAKALPENCAVIYRYNNFDETLAQELRQLTLRKSQQFLIRSGKSLTHSDGQHFTRNTDLSLIGRARHDTPKALLTMAAIKEGNYTARLPEIDGLLVSAIFASHSPSAGTPIGVEALRLKVESWPVPIFALGGITACSAPRLEDTGIAGLAAVGALTEEIAL